jgi:UDP-galactopyranose mutase
MSNYQLTPTILCLAHLGWDFVWQRPQHILSRMARHYPLIYVNEPRLVTSTDPDYPADHRPYLKQVAQEGKLTAWQPIFPDWPEVTSYWREFYLRLVQGLLPKPYVNGHGPIRPPLILWFYTPMPYYFLDHVQADLVVYDIMDELANFKNAPANMREREAQLLERAQVVFTGGRSMYEARQGRHSNMHLFPSGVEVEHFAKARQPETAVPSTIAHLPRPVLGYYGVIDERIDLELLREAAIARPDWSFVMIGPVAKIEIVDLPRQPNIHYLGQQPYSQLPNFLKGMDVCLMPFALNEATRYISPTKTLEYMAAHKPIVSTPIADVVRNWGHVVRTARNAEAFVAAIEAALAETAVTRAVRIAQEEDLLADYAWDNIAAQMRGHMETAMRQKQNGYQNGQANVWLKKQLPNATPTAPFPSTPVPASTTTGRSSTVGTMGAEA